MRPKEEAALVSESPRIAALGTAVALEAPLSIAYLDFAEPPGLPGPVLRFSGESRAPLSAILTR